MGSDGGVVSVRERVWVTVVDHEQDPPKPIREVFIENGGVVETRDLTSTEESHEQR